MEEIKKMMTEHKIEDTYVEHLNESCDKCGQELKKVHITFTDGTTKVNNAGCRCEANQYINQKQRAIKADIFEKGSMIYGDYKEKTFEAYQPQNESQQKALALSKYYAEQFQDQLKNGQNILFQGTFGTGKTHLAAAIRKFVASNHYTVLFMSLPDYLDKVKLKFNDDQKAISDSEKILKMAKDAELLILDDVGANRMTDFEVSELFKLVDARRGKCTIYTTNYSSKDFTSANVNGRKNMELHRVFSRMMEHTKPIVIKGDDHRMKGLV